MEVVAVRIAIASGVGGGCVFAQQSSSGVCGGGGGSAPAAGRAMRTVSSVVAPRGAAAESSRKGLRQSGSFLERHRSHQVELLGPSRILWPSGSGCEQPRRISEEALIQGEYEGFVNYETLDGSVGEEAGDGDGDGCARVDHTRESFAKFLRHYPASQLTLVSQACYLSNLAYIIGEIKGDELEKDHRLRLVTSSIQQENAATTAQFNKTLMAPATAYALAATATYLQSRKSSTEWSNGTSRAHAGKEKHSKSSEAFSRAVGHEMTTAMTKFMDSPDPNSVASTIAGGNREVEPSTSNASSACGWFVCDEHATGTRFFSIQGSETMASWKANLQFQPTQFEDSTTGVMVHKGVYEIAKTMYEQMLPLVQSHMAAYGKRARVSFTGHSLGGSLGVLLLLMFRYRGVVPVSALSPVYTFGAPSVLNGGNKLLKRLGFSVRHIQSVVISRDLVPRIFASDIPEQMVEVLKRVSQNFRNLPSFVNQRQLYTTTGQLLVLQPEAQQAPGHPLLPSGSGLYVLDHSSGTNSSSHPLNKVGSDSELRAAEAAFLNSPHPLDIMSNLSAYGAEGTISRDHDPRSYRKAVNHVLKQTVRCLQFRKRIERWQFKERMAELPAAAWPPSPAGNSKCSKRKSAETCVMFSNHDAVSNCTASAGACNYLQITRNHVNCVSCVS